MSKITFFPLGNADATLILTNSNKLVLIDYGNMHNGKEDDIRTDLAVEINTILYELKRDYIDVVVITHLDDDHYNRFSEFFFLLHSEKYQDDDRIKINELWVPAYVVLEKGDQVKDEAKILRAEARYRLKNKTSIRIFSKPDLLVDWLAENDLKLSEVSGLIADAGELVEGFTIEEDGVEFFPHSPFAADLDDEPGYEIDRNDASLILHATFLVEENRDIKIMFGSDAASPVWEDIVRITEYYNNESRLEWDIFKISHHSSYRSLNENKDEWEERHLPVPLVKKLFEEYSRDGCTLISTSVSIDKKEDEKQPPHKEALDYYKSVADKMSGRLIITMEHPDSNSPSPLNMEINRNGIEILTQKKFRINSSFIKQHRNESYKPSGLWAEI